MPNEILKYDIAKRALYAARTFEDVISIKDKAEAYRAIAQVAKDDEAVRWATEIKTRAEWMAGRMLLELPKHKGGNPKLTCNSLLQVGTKLSEVGATRMDAHRWQVFGRQVPEEKQLDAEIAAGHITRVAIVRATAPPKPPKPPKMAPAPEVDPQDEEAPLTDAEMAAEQLKLTAEIHAENMRLAAILEEDEPLKAAMKENKQLREENERLKRINFGLTNDRNDAIRLSKHWQNKFEKLEKARR